ncbi:MULTISPECIES: hypothetical protein [unclassified Sporosarcina]|uniref:hypothetical protein n=1 Tax=unclassified Sporosarcina TaxID=2647733 RepID=UPI00130417DA|nr:MULTISPECIES: hypothetical protein [unclassified Sporosarcina]
MDRAVGRHTDGKYIWTTTDQPVICEVDQQKWYVADKSQVYSLHIIHGVKVESIENAVL